MSRKRPGVQSGCVRFPRPPVFSKTMPRPADNTRTSLPSMQDPAAPPLAVASVLESTAARVGIAVSSTDDSRSFGTLVDEPFTQASAIKIPILWELHRAAAASELSLRETLPIKPGDGSGGCGLLQHFLPGASQIALGDLAVLMIVLSDNVATNLLIERIGIHSVNRLLEGFRLEETKLRRKMMDAKARAEGRENTASPGEALFLMRHLQELEQGADPVSTAVLQTLRLTKESPVTKVLPKDVHLATKPGMLDGLRTEWSLVESDDGVSYAMALMADGASDSELESLFEALADAIHGHMII